MMIFTNHYHGRDTNIGRAYTDAIESYAYTMLVNYRGAYEVARYRKAQTCLIDEDGFMIMEKRTDGGMIKDE